MTDHLLPLERFGIIVFVVLLAGLLLTYLRQPRVAGYLLVGMLIGPHGFGLSPSQEMTEFLSEMGVVFLLFFVGMEVSVERLIRGWKISVIGTIFQILFSLGFSWLVGWWNGWNLGEIILIGFMISLSSTAVVLTLLQNWKELDTPVGEDVLGILFSPGSPGGPDVDYSGIAWRRHPDGLFNRARSVGRPPYLWFNCFHCHEREGDHTDTENC